MANLQPTTKNLCLKHVVCQLIQWIDEWIGQKPEQAKLGITVVVTSTVGCDEALPRFNLYVISLYSINNLSPYQTKDIKPIKPTKLV